MKRINFRILIGAALILLGVLMLLERFGIFHGASDIFWGIVFLAGGVYFLYRFANNMGGEWWAAIPGFALVGMGADNILPGILGDWTGLFFLGFLGLGFFAVYFTARQERWWALIPGGVLVTLGAISVLSDFFSSQETGGFFFLGLGLTFLLVAVLASAQWAYIPSIILLAMGVMFETAFAGTINYVWPVVLILAGLLLIYRFVRRQ